MAKKCNSGVYGFRNRKTNKWYIGSSTYIPTRKSHHIADLIKQKHHSAKFQNAWNKYEFEDFEFSVLEEVPIPEGMSKLDFKSILLAREDYWTEKHDAVKNGYNVALKAGSCLGIKRSPEYKMKRSQLSKAQWVPLLATQESAAAVAENMGHMAKQFWISLKENPESYAAHCTKLKGDRPSMKGRPQSPEATAKRIAKCAGQKRTLETRAQMSESALKSWDGRRGLPSPKEHVDKRQAGRNKLFKARDLMASYMGLYLHYKGQVFSSQIDAYLIKMADDKIIKKRNQAAARQKRYRLKAAKQLQQQTELSNG